MSQPGICPSASKASLWILFGLAQACQPAVETESDPAQVTDIAGVQGVMAIEGSWSGELVSTTPLDAQDIADSEVIGLFQFEEIDPNLSELGFDLSTRFEDGTWWTGYGFASPMSTEQGKFEAIVYGPDETSCRIEGDWFTRTDQLFMAFTCNSWEGEPSEYELDAGRF
jgi:hypothetical protein